MSAAIVEPCKANLGPSSGLAHTGIRNADRVPVWDQPFCLAALVDICGNPARVIQPEPVYAEAVRTEAVSTARLGGGSETGSFTYSPLMSTSRTPSMSPIPFPVKTGLPSPKSCQYAAFSPTPPFRQ